MTQITQYNSINDVVDLNPIYQIGQYEIWYQNRSTLEKLVIPLIIDNNLTFASKIIDTKNLDKTHILIGKIGGDRIKYSLDDIFGVMQGEQWSPNGEAISLVQKLGVHTSMMVGDIIKDTKTDIISICMATGWGQLSN